MSKLTVTELHLYPIKSCAGTKLESAQIGAKGIEFDRHWMIVDMEGKALTQRELPNMALIVPELASEEDKVRDTNIRLKLSAPGMAKFTLNEAVQLDKQLDVNIWNNICRAVDQGDEVSVWLSRYLEKRCRLVEMAPQFVRQVDQKYATEPDDQVGFADGYPLLLISQESLDELNSRLEKPVLMDRFRPNVVVSGGSAFEEDTWKSIKINDVTFASVKPCARCTITTIEQSTAMRSAEPLRTLARYRSVENKVMFGQNLIHKATGRIKLGAAVEILH